MIQKGFRHTPKRGIVTRWDLNMTGEIARDLRLYHLIFNHHCGVWQNWWDCSTMDLYISGVIVEQKCQKSIFCINRAKYYLPQKALITLYHSIIYYHLVCLLPTQLQLHQHDLIRKNLPHLKKTTVLELWLLIILQEKLPFILFTSTSMHHPPISQRTPQEPFTMI